MRNSKPLQWIEQAEAREVLVTAMFEKAPWSPSREIGLDAARRWLANAQGWFAAALPAWHAQPVPVARGQGYGDDFGSSCCW